MDLPLWVWFGFTGGVLAMLALDLGLFHRKAHVVSVREAAPWSAVWVSLAQKPTHPTPSEALAAADD